MTRKSLFLATALGASLFSTIVWAGPFNDFETQVRAAYADYRGALFQTNKNDKPATEAALSALTAKWAALASKWSRQAPPQYVDDPAFPQSLANVGTIINNATTEATKGELAKAHEVLEGIRDELGKLRERNGVIVFSDRMNAYHAKMEDVLGRDYSGFDAKGMGLLREDAAVLAYLYADIAAKPPTDANGKPDFAQALGAMKNTVDALVSASRGSDAAAAKKAVDSLKGPYSMLFLKFG